jgi:hypothetical protein
MSPVTASSIPQRQTGLASLIAALAALAVALIGVEVAAQSRPVRIDYVAHEGCPGAEAFLDEVTSRTSLARAPAAESEDALDVRVRITRTSDGSRGRVTLGKGGDLPVREINGPTCDEVVRALAFITALKIDPRASLSPSPRALSGGPGSASSAAGAPSPGLLPEPPPAPLPIETPSTIPPTSPAPVVSSAPVMAPPQPLIGAGSMRAPASSGKLHSTIGAHASVTFGAAPRALLGGGPFVELRADGGLGTSIRLAAEVATTGAIDLGPGGARFTWGIGRLDACPAFVRPTRRLAIAPCLGAEGGLIRAEGRPGRTISAAKQVTVPWASLGALARVAVDAGDVVRVDVQGGPQFPLVRRSFVFETPAFLIHEVPAIIWTLRLGAGLSFW